ncbi:MAG: hypothetical protein ACI4D2_03120 [Lachnospiraceae bacterium]
MRLTITYYNVHTKKAYDIMADREQRIKTTVRVLQETMPEIFDGIEEPVNVQSERTKRRINIEKTYREAGIYQGDILRLENQRI